MGGIAWGQLLDFQTALEVVRDRCLDAVLLEWYKKSAYYRLVGIRRSRRMQAALRATLMLPRPQRSKSSKFLSVSNFSNLEL